jgi:hypothetical protein
VVSVSVVVVLVVSLLSCVMVHILSRQLDRFQRLMISITRTGVAANGYALIARNTR